MTSSHSEPAPCQWFSRLATVLDRRSAPRLALLFLGAVLARGRRTVTSWIRAAQLGGQYQSCYLAVAAAGKRADHIAWRLFVEVVRPLLAGAKRLTLALDDTPTKRYGSHIQGVRCSRRRPPPDSIRYVERNSLPIHPVERAEPWPWSSLDPPTLLLSTLDQRPVPWGDG